MIRVNRASFALAAALAGLWLISSVVPALAGFDPISLTIEASIFALLEAGVGVTAALALTPFVFTGLLVGGAYALNALLAPSLPGSGGNGSLDPGQAKETFENSESPELRAVGRVRVGGLKAFGNTAGANRYRLVFHCKGEIDSFEQYFLGGREVTVDPDGSVTSPPWVKLSGSWAYIKTALGTGSETAWSDLTTDFSTLWTSNHRARGIAQSLIKYINPGLTDPKFLKLYQSGPPDLEVVIRAEKSVYDPRALSSAWTQNGILNALHILLSYPEFTIADIDVDFIGDEADRADALVATLAGNVARARCCGVWTSEIPRGTNMQKVLDSIGAWIVPRANGEQIGIQLIDDQPTAEVTVALRNIISIDWRSGPEGVERPNVCRLKYYSPERNYEMTEIDLTGIGWARIDDEVTAYGEKIFDVELPFCPDAGQAQRRARQMFALARADTGVVKTNMDGLAVWGARLVSFEFPDDLGTILTMIGTPRVLDDQGQVEIPFVVWPTLTTWNTATDEAAAPAAIPDLTFSSPLTQPSQPSDATVVTYQGANGSATRVFYTIPGDASFIEATYRTYTAGNPNAWTSMTEYVAPDGLAHAYVPSDLSGQVVDFRVRGYVDDDTISIWSTTFQTTLAINNTGPVATFDFNPVNLLISAWSDSHNVAYMVLTGTSAPSNDIIKPGEKLSWTGTSGAFTAQAKSTNSTGGTTLSLKINAPGDDTTKTILVGTPLGGGAVKFWWRASSFTCDTIVFTGTGMPTPISTSTSATGSFTVSGLSAGSYTFTAESRAGVTPVDTGPASITLTVT